MDIFKKGKKETRSEISALRCSFCLKSEKQIEKLIGGPNVYICDECVKLCNEILAEDRGQQKHETQELIRPSATGVSCALCHFPVEAEEAIMVPDRGPICPACLDAVKAALSHGE